MRDFGTVRPGTTLYIPFATYDSNDPSASVTLTGLLTSDVEIYKDGSVTQRASDAGYALLDTDGIDFDLTTGIHGISIDLADNTTAGFYAAGSQYWVVIASVTVDAATINFIAATFRIGYESAILNTTIATLASQTSFTLTSGPAEDDALNGMEVLIHDVASAVQIGRAVILDYTGSTKTVTLAAGTTFTVAATDNISVMGPSPLQPTTSGRTLLVGSAGAADANVEKWNTTDVPAEHTAGYPIVTVKDGIGAGEINTNAGAIALVDLVTTLTTYTGNTVQTGDAFARIGAAGASLTDLGGMSTTMKAQVNTEVVDALNVDTYAEPGQEAPAATNTIRKMLQYLFKAWRNKSTETSTTYSLYDDAGTTVDQKSTNSDDGTTFTSGKVGTGP